MIKMDESDSKNYPEKLTYNFRGRNFF